MACNHADKRTYSIADGHVHEEVCKCGAWRKITFKPVFSRWQYPAKHGRRLTDKRKPK